METYKFSIFYCKGRNVETQEIQEFYIITEFEKPFIPQSYISNKKLGDLVIINAKQHSLSINIIYSLIHVEMVNYIDNFYSNDISFLPNGIDIKKFNFHSINHLGKYISLIYNDKTIGELERVCTILTNNDPIYNRQNRTFSFVPVS